MNNERVEHTGTVRRRITWLVKTVNYFLVITILLASGVNFFKEIADGNWCVRDTRAMTGENGVPLLRSRLSRTRLIFQAAIRIQLGRPGSDSRLDRYANSQVPPSFYLASI